jgi:hypothetical protein
MNRTDLGSPHDFGFGVKMNRYLLVGLAALAAVGCGRSPELIDRTQPNYVKKSDLLNGTWYYQETIVDVPPTAVSAVIGYPGDLEKIRFEAQENYLVAYRTYERVPGLDPLVDKEKSGIGHTVYKNGLPYKGAPVGAWRITSHFDRQRQYNASTGEQSNILEENGSDRPWYQREYIRVNWSDNSVFNALGLGFDALNAGYGKLRYVTNQDQNIGEDAFITDYVTDAAGKKNLNYFDYTVRALQDPEKIYYPGYGYLNYCWFNPKVDCGSTEVKMRASFRKIDEEHVQDYEPLAYNDKLQTKFGFFRTLRITYDRSRAATDSGKIYYANRHNLWQKAHYTDADGKRQTLDVAKRDVKPVVYFLSSNFPPELVPAAKGPGSLEESWDYAFRRAVAVPRGLEPKDVPQMFYVCTSPVKEGDPAACGKPGTNGGRLGDLRFNQIPWIDQPQLSGPLGLGPSAADPETGEIIQGVANIYGAALDTWTGQASQIVDLLNGELTLADLIDGKDVASYTFEHLNATDPRRPINGPWTSQSGLVSDAQKPLSSYAEPQGQLASIVKMATQKGHLPLHQQDRRAVVEKLISQNPALENELINEPEVRAMVLANAPGSEFRTKLQTDPAFYRTVARQMMLGVDPMSQRQEQRLFRAEHMPNNGCLLLAEFFDDAWYGLAKEMAKKYTVKVADLQAKGDPTCASRNSCTLAEAKKLGKDYIWLQLRISGWRSVAEHEVGHTVGLTHNFGGSFDALNFKDGYWDLRKDTIGVLVGGQRVLPVTGQNMLDAAKPNQAQIDGRMGELQYSTIMDYGSRMNSDIHGIGKYDNAAILFAYAGGAEPGYVEVFNDYRRDYQNPNVTVPTDNAMKQLVIRGAQTEIPLTLATHYTPVSSMYSDRFHYTTLPFHFADKDKIQGSFSDALNQGISRMNSRSYRKWSELEAVYQKIDTEMHAYNLRSGGWGDQDWDTARSIISKVAYGSPVEVPYMYCADGEVGANIACNRWDFGADVYEMTKDWLGRNDEYYVFDNFRRDRIMFSPSSVLNRKFSRGLMNIPNVYQHWLYNIYWYQSYYDLTAEQMEQYFGTGDPIWQNYFTMAVVDSTNKMMQQLATPSAGYHGKLANGNWIHLTENRNDNGRIVDPNGKPGNLESSFIQNVKDKYATSASPITEVVYVPRGPGRSMYTLYDGNGYDFFTRVNEVGHFWDQYLALEVLSSAQTNFLGVDRGADALRYSLPYYMTFNKELSNLTMGVWTDDHSRYAGSLLKTGNGEATILPQQFLRAENYLKGFDYPPPAVTPVDGNGNTVPLDMIEASPSWGTKFYTEVFGMAYFTDNYNQEYASFNQVFRLGSGETVTPANGYETVTFADPFGGSTYAALRRVGDTRPPSAPQMVQTAVQYKANWDLAKAATPQVYKGLTAAQWEAKTRDAIRSLEMMRGLYNIFGQAY